MKKITATLLLLAGLCGSLSAQPPVTTNLRLQLEAASGYNTLPGADVWTDLSGNSNDVTAVNPTTAEPVWVANASGSGFAGVVFDGTSDVMTRIASTTAGFGNTEATIFIVRIANTAYTTLPGPFATQWNAMVAIGDNNTYNNDFAMMSDWAIHSSSGGNWVNRDHPCYRFLPDCRPAVVAGMFRTGTAAGDLDYYVNAAVSSNTPAIQGSPSPFTAAGRGICIGATWGATSGSIAANTYFQGAILEVLAYDRALTIGEIAQTHQYLMGKYSVSYTCMPPRCDPDFSWSMNTATPNTYTFTAQNILPYQYEWTVNGVVAGTGRVLNRTFPTSVATSYKVCLRLLDCNGTFLCSQCFDLCHGDMGSSTSGCGPHFTVSGNTNTPMQVTLAPVGGGVYNWAAYNGPISSPPYASGGPSLSFTVPVGVFGAYHTFQMTSPSSPGCYRYSPNHCFYNNTPSPYKLSKPLSDPELSIVPNPASDLVSLQLSQPAEEILLVRITDMSGRTVYSSEAAAGTNKIQVSLDQFATGMYLVQLRGRNVQLNGKFVKE